MTITPVTAWSPPPSGLDQLLQLWMFPMKLGLDLMQIGSALLLGALPAGDTSGTMTDVARAAEEKLAEVDDKPGDTIPTPAALIA